MGSRRVVLSRVVPAAFDPVPVVQKNEQNLREQKSIVFC